MPGLFHGVVPKHNLFLNAPRGQHANGTEVRRDITSFFKVADLRM